MIKVQLFFTTIDADLRDSTPCRRNRGRKSLSFRHTKQPTLDLMITIRLKNAYTVRERKGRLRWARSVAGF